MQVSVWDLLPSGTKWRDVVRSGETGRRGNLVGLALGGNSRPERGFQKGLVNAILLAVAALVFLYCIPIWFGY